MKERKTWSKKKTIFLAIAIAILIAAFILCYRKGLFFTFFIGIPLASCLSGLFIYLAFQWQFDDAFYKLDIEKEKMRDERKDEKTTSDWLPFIPFIKK